MPDFLSRAWHFTDVQIVAHSNSYFPQPVPWQICNRLKPMNLSLILALSKKQCGAMEVLLPTPPERLPIGRSGVTSVLVTKLTPSSKISQISSHTCKSLQPDTETVDISQVVDPSGLKQFLTPSFPSHRNSRRWGPTTPGKRCTD